MSAVPPSPIGPEQLALLARRVSIIVGTGDATLRPHVMRAVGARLSGDRRRVTVLLPQAGSGDVLADLRANGRIAVVFSEPSSHRTLQVKGGDAVVAACGPDDRELAARTLEGFVDEIGQLGLAAEVAHTMLGHDDDLVAVHFTIAEAFEQTPGPAAGERLPPALG
jgi:hypothetical protein